MDSYEWNKIAGAVLFALLVGVGLRIATEILFEAGAPESPGYVIATEGEGGGAEPQAPQSIAVLLASADAKAGANSAKKCLACHTLAEGEPNKVGPNLYGIVMRPIASHEGYTYSDPMHAFAQEAGDWTYEHLDTFLHDPAGTVPGTKMTFAGLKNDSERANVIAYLRTLAANPEPLPAPEAAAPSEGAAPSDAAAAPAESAPPAENAAAPAAATTESATATEAPAGTMQAPEPAAPAADQHGAMAPATQEQTAMAAAPMQPAAETPAPAAEPQAPMAAAPQQPAAETPAPAPEPQAPMAAAQPPAAETPAPPAEQQTAAAETPAPAQEQAAAAPAGTPAGDVAKGQIFAKRCQVCHSFEEGGPNKVGPHLFGVVDRPVASVAGYAYSDAMKAFSEGGAKHWDTATLDTYLTDPKSVVPGTKMIFPGVKSDADRANVIAYLSSLK